VNLLEEFNFETMIMRNIEEISKICKVVEHMIRLDFFAGFLENKGDWDLEAWNYITSHRDSMPIAVTVTCMPLTHLGSV